MSNAFPVIKGLKFHKFSGGAGPDPPPPPPSAVYTSAFSPPPPPPPPPSSPLPLPLTSERTPRPLRFQTAGAVGIEVVELNKVSPRSDR